MNIEPLMKAREAVMADEGLQQDIRELMFEGPDRRRRAMKYIKEKGLSFSLD